LGVAVYQQAELRRLRGEFEQAKEAYRLASQYGCEPAPGLALLRLAEGHVAAAAAASRRVVDQTHGHLARPTMLAAHVEIMLAAGDVEAARVAFDELSKIAAEMNAPLLRAIADYAGGSVRLAQGNASSALGDLRRAYTGWWELAMPYEAARTRVLMGLACRALGDEDSAEWELDAARAAFEQLGAQPDLTRMAELVGTAGRTPADTVTARECEVLRLVAEGKSNREIGSELFISEHTVARHLQNIFAKLGLSSRAAATAYAYEHGLV
jgi:ATP/maltotriose-dependent transcriptional regulator MalT